MVSIMKLTLSYNSSMSRVINEVFLLNGKLIIVTILYLESLD